MAKRVIFIGCKSITYGGISCHQLTDETSISLLKSDSLRGNMDPHIWPELKMLINKTADNSYSSKCTPPVWFSILELVLLYFFCIAFLELFIMYTVKLWIWEVYLIQWSCDNTVSAWQNFILALGSFVQRAFIDRMALTTPCCHRGPCPLCGHGFTHPNPTSHQLARQLWHTCEQKLLSASRDDRVTLSRHRGCVNVWFWYVRPSSGRHRKWARCGGVEKSRTKVSMKQDFFSAWRVRSRFQIKYSFLFFSPFVMLLSAVWIISFIGKRRQQ